jgi:hypothetical protein
MTENSAWTELYKPIESQRIASCLLRRLAMSRLVREAARKNRYWIVHAIRTKLSLRDDLSFFSASDDYTSPDSRDFCHVGPRGVSAMETNIPGAEG